MRKKFIILIIILLFIVLSVVLIVSSLENKKIETLIPGDINIEVESNPSQDDKTEESAAFEGVEVKVKFDDVDKPIAESIIYEEEQETSSSEKSKNTEVGPNETPPIPD